MAASVGRARRQRLAADTHLTIPARSRYAARRSESRRVMAPTCAALRAEPAHLADDRCCDPALSTARSVRRPSTRRSSLTVFRALYRVLGVGSRRVLLVGVVASVVLAGCGGSSHEPSTAATSARAATASTTTTAATPASGIASRVLASDELPGFKGSHTTVYNTASGWLAAETGATQVAASQTKPLTRLGFVAAAREDLTGPGGRDGLSLVEQFKTPGGARSELANELSTFKATAPGYQPFPVAGIPGARGYAAEGPGLNLAFASGDYYYLVGEFVPAVSASSEATLIAAAKRLYRGVHG